MARWINLTGIVVHMDKKCMLTECKRIEQTRRGYCKLHYRRFMTTGDPLKVKRVFRDTPVIERFRLIGWDEVVGPLETLCWSWRGNCSSDKDGYGTIGVFGVRHRAHRLSYETFVGPIPEGHLIRHKCDNPPCVRPDHLEPGTVKENTHDMLRRGRHVPPRGAKNGSSVLTETQVRDIRALQGSRHVRDVSEEFDIAVSTVYSIWSGLRWSHLD